ncbi:hypothetical protein AB8615_08425 [Litorimonas sp. RW-G-Af-16]
MRMMNSGVRVYVGTVVRVSETEVATKRLDPAIYTDGASSGYVRLAPEAASGFGKTIKAQPDPKTNRWFAFNQNDLWADDNTRMEIWLDEHKIEIDTDLPPLRPDIPNNHRDYMWTWFIFAGLLIIFYLLIHFRAGRLGVKR